MILELKGFLKHSSIYGIGNILSKIGIFLMIPVYTRYLSPSDYGSLELFYVTASVLRTFLSMGIAHATLRFFFEYKDTKDQQKVISTAIVGSGLFGIFCVFIFFNFTDFFSNLFFKSTDYSNMFKLVSVMFLLELSMEVSTAFIRAKEYSIFYTTVSLFQLLIRIALNLYMLIVLKYGVMGILIGDLIATFVAWSAFTWLTLKFSGISLQFSKLKELLGYSYPLALGSFSGLIINNSDRYFLNAYIGLGAIGIYALAYRFGSALQSLFTEPFTKSYGPFRFSIMHREDAGKLYSRMLTYFLFGFVFLGLGISVLAKEILQIMAAESFWPAYSVIPIIVLASAGAGSYYVLQIGIYVHKKTKFVPLILLMVAGVNISGNILLIPSFGAYGAAASYFLTNLALCVITYIISQRYLPIFYEFGRITKIFSAALILYGGSLLIDANSLSATIALKTILALTFPLVLYIIGFYHEDEQELISRNIKKIRLRALKKNWLR